VVASRDDGILRARGERLGGMALSWEDSRRKGSIKERSTEWDRERVKVEEMLVDDGGTIVGRASNTVCINDNGEMSDLIFIKMIEHLQWVVLRTTQ
jgi:hypothetical protein